MHPDQAKKSYNMDVTPCFDKTLLGFMRPAIDIYKRHKIPTGEYEIDLMDLEKEFPV